jgi:hypothetical protein
VGTQQPPLECKLSIIVPILRILGNGYWTENWRGKLGRDTGCLLTLEGGGVKRLREGFFLEKICARGLIGEPNSDEAEKIFDDPLLRTN